MPGDLHNECDVVTDENAIAPDAWFAHTLDARQLGFRLEEGSVHTSQTILASNASTLIDALGVEAEAWSRATLQKKIVEENILGKRTQSARLGSVRDMAAIYALDTLPPVTRAALALWNSAENPSLLLGALAVARDPILRASAAVILAAEPGEAISFREMAKFLESRYPGRFSAGTLRAVGERCVSSWGQMGHLSEGRPRRRMAAQADAATAAFAVFLALCSGYAGTAALASNWMRMLDVSHEQALSLLRRAEAQGDVRLRIAGHVFDIELRGPLARFAAGPEQTNGLL